MKIVIDLKIFSKEVALKTMSTLGEYVEPVEITSDSDSLIITLTKKLNIPDEEIKAKIYSKLVEQSLKDEIYEKTKDIRTLILANAFSKTSLIDY